MMEVAEEIITELQIQNKELKQQIDTINTQLGEWEHKFRTYTKDESLLLFKIQQVKQVLLDTEITRSGFNSFGKYNYFELKDITPVIVPALLDKGLASAFFCKDNCMFLQIVDSKTGAWIQWNTKLRVIHREGLPKGDITVLMKDEQAVQTYARRTLWLQALDIVEHVPEDIEKQGNTLNKKINKQNKNNSEDVFIVPEDIDMTSKSIFDTIQKDFEKNKVVFKKEYIRNKLGSMKKNKKIDDNMYSKCMKIVE
ncbi:ERF family protein [Methanosphaera sp. ISO3-F5]|uniref:ERF family protein n=1 Tax=Methanosphaera sp. ISO3-F5 TaxID=1452353 RepID=UPI002B261929|nr:ERF family protein [Methanosphaera sp. ISO3-F5]WQH64041.1 ERF family protein [Methanosphaera sp. ISO3-F5]